LGEDLRVVRTKKIFAGAKKVLDNRAGILYNKDRSEEERKTLGPTADLRFFKLYALDRTTSDLRPQVVRTKIFFAKCEKTY